MPGCQGPFYIFEIAYALARQPGRLETDQDEAKRIAKDIAERYLRGEFEHQEVVAKFGDPPRFVPYANTGEYDPETINLNLWYVAVALTYPGAKRYIENCGLAGAARLLREWFGERLAVGERRRPGPTPKKRNEIAARMLDDLTSGRRTPEQLLGDTLPALSTAYGGSPNTAREARVDALSKHAELQRSDH